VSVSFVRGSRTREDSPPSRRRRCLVERRRWEVPFDKSNSSISIASVFREHSFRISRRNEARYVTEANPLLWRQQRGRRMQAGSLINRFRRHVHPRTTKEHYVLLRMRKDKAARKYVPMTYVFARSSNCPRERSRIIGYYWRPEAASYASELALAPERITRETSGVRAI